MAKILTRLFVVMKQEGKKIKTERNKQDTKADTHFFFERCAVFRVVEFDHTYSRGGTADKEDSHCFLDTSLHMLNCSILT